MALGKDGLDVARKLAPASAATASAPIAAPIAKGNANSAPMRISIAGISINGSRVTFTNSTLPTALTHVVDAIKVKADRIELDSSRPLIATASATLASGGAVTAKLKFDQRCLAGEAESAVERVPLAPLSRTSIATRA